MQLKTIQSSECLQCFESAGLATGYLALKIVTFILITITSI